MTSHNFADSSKGKCKRMGKLYQFQQVKYLKVVKRFSPPGAKKFNLKITMALEFSYLLPRNIQTPSSIEITNQLIPLYFSPSQFSPFFMKQRVLLSLPSNFQSILHRTARYSSLKLKPNHTSDPLESNQRMLQSELCALTPFIC